MSSEERVTRVVSENKQPIRVKLTRGARGTYRWEIEDAGDNADAVLYTISYVDDQLKNRYLEPEANPAQPPVKGPENTKDPHARMDHRLKHIREAGEELAPSKEGEQS